MANQPGVWGIDLGQCALKAVRLEVVDGQVTATAFDYVEHPKILSQPDADPDQLTREALEKFLSRNKLRGDVVAISVPGQSGLARFVKLPPVEEKKITDIVKFEAKQQIPFPLEEVVWDYQKIGSGTVTDGFAMETEIGLFAIKRDMVSRSIQHFRDVGVEVQVVQMSPLALCNFVSYDLLGKGGPEPKKEDEAKKKAAAAGEKAEDEGEDQEEEEKPDDDGKRHGVVALDIGADNSNLVITDGEKIIWQRPIPIGGNHFTRALTKDLKLTFAKAEHLKRNATKSPDLRKILASLKPVLNDFAGEIQRSLGYFTNTHRNAHLDYMMGLGSAFRLPGLQKFLSEKLQLEVRKLQKPERLAGDEVLSAPSFTENVLSFGVAYGLALQGLHLTRLRTNLLPHELHVERLVRSKKPWAAAAAAVLLLGVVGLMMGYAKEHHSVNIDDDPIKAELTNTKTETDKASAKKAAYQAKEKEIEDKITAVKAILAGQDEQFDWLQLNPFISECLPRPDGTDVLGEYYPFIFGTVKKAWADDTKEIVVEGPNGVTYHCQLSADPKLALKVSDLGTNKQLDKKDLREGDRVKIAAYYYNDKARQYWTPAAVEAWQSFWKRQALAKDDNPVAPDAGIDDLTEINLEAVYPRYCDDLSKITVFANLEAEKNNLKDRGMRDIDTQKAPEGAGWVVELRGYTYQKDRDLFLKNTLVRKLNTLRHRDRKVFVTKIDRLKEGEKLPAQPGDVIDGLVSHAYLHEYKPVENPQPGDFKLLNESVVKDFIGPGRSGGDWSPLEGSGKTGAAGAPGAPGLGNRGGVGQRTSSPPSGGSPGAGGPGGNPFDKRPRGGVGGPSSGPGSGVAQPPRGPGSNQKSGPGGVGEGPGRNTETPAVASRHTRTEFIILFIWKEPTPSDKLLGPAEAGAPASGSGFGGPAAGAPGAGFGPSMGPPVGGGKGPARLGPGAGGA